MGRPLTPEQPPWEMHVVEGMADGTIGLIAKVHHSVVDGVAGAEMLAKLLDLTPEGSAVTEPCPPWMPARPAVAGAADDRCPARPSSGAPSGDCAPPAKSAVPRCAWRAARWTTASARCRSRWARPTRSSLRSVADRAVSFAQLSMDRRAGPQDALRVDDQRRGARRLLRGAPHPPGGARPGRREPTGGRGAGVGARGHGRRGGGQPALGHVRASGQRQEDTAGAPAHRDRGERVVQGAGARRRLRPDGDPDDRGAAARVRQDDDSARGPLGRAAQAAGGQPHDVQRARARLPPLLRRHGTAGRVPARAR